jgi:hypothetical protein
MASSARGTGPRLMEFSSFAGERQSHSQHDALEYLRGFGRMPRREALPRMREGLNEKIDGIRGPARSSDKRAMRRR